MDKLQLKALIFIPTLTTGGAERVASILANQWCTYPNAHVAIITLFDEPLFYPLDSRVEYVCIGIGSNEGGLGRLVDLMHALQSLRREIGERKPNFVLSFMNKYNAFCVTALLGMKQCVIVAERGSPTEILPHLRVILRKLTYPLAAAVLVQSKAARDFILSTTRARRVAVLFNPVTQIIDPRDRQPKKIILNVSRLQAGKGHSDLLKAFASLCVEGWSLVLCGDGPMRPDLERRARELGITGQTHFLGTQADLRPHLRRAGIFAFTSYSEGFPNALAEAVLAGIPCVSYDCPTGPSELVEDGRNGFLVKVGDVEELARRLRELMTNADLCDRFSRNAVQVAKKVDTEIVSQQYFDYCTAPVLHDMG